MFSYGLAPVWTGSNRNVGQSTRTVNVADAARPLDWPLAKTMCWPGLAPVGTWIALVKEPLGSVMAWATRMGSNEIRICSLGPNPCPLTVVEDPGGPEGGESAMEADAVPPAAGASGARAAAVATRNARNRPRGRGRPLSVRRLRPSTGVAVMAPSPFGFAGSDLDAYSVTSARPRSTDRPRPSASV